MSHIVAQNSYSCVSIRILSFMVGYTMLGKILGKLRVHIILVN